ncbi:asparaginase [Ruania zhangjianzhongii]|uniref:asparaginase n=1 Tax=Ruania zhangjianzhongii TaxID=2603206 RepID=UPI001F1E6E97|nr:asparaginase [Ruania zhangjianzhongii]
MKPPPRLDPPARGADLAWVVRSGMIESVHAGHLLAVAADGTDALALGAPEQQIYARSSLKPLQTVAMLRTGVPLTAEQVALACASHNGEGRHREVVRDLLAGAGLTEADLGNTPDWPLDRDAAAAWADAGRVPEPIAQNCSGKHAAMLASCARSGWDTGTYLDPEHPLQQHILAVIAELTGETVRYLAVDGCGAPQPSTTVRGLARAFAAIATAPEGTAEHRVAAAMRAHPFLVAGTGRDATAAMQSVPGLIAKDGAEGVYAAALPDGRAVALKVADGASRPRPVLLAAALRALGERGHWPWSRVPVLGHGQPVGSVLPAFEADGGASAAQAASLGSGESAGGSADGDTDAAGSPAGEG